MLKDIRLNQIKYVLDNAKHVKINQDKLDSYIASLNSVNNYEHACKKYKKDFTEKEMIILAFILESMNFCFWKEPMFEYNGQKRSTAMMNKYIDSALLNKEFVNIDYMINLKYEDLINIFGIEEGNLKNRYTSLMYTVNKIYNNKNFFLELFSIKSTDELYKFITSFDNFNDVSNYKGKDIYFYKRATLLVNDLFELSDTIKNNIKNIDSVLGCADYVIPRGLRMAGIIEYDNELSGLIDNGTEIEKNSEYEVEIRAVTLYIIECVKNKNNKNINSARWDNIIWNSFRGKGGISHKTDTIFY